MDKYNSDSDVKLKEHLRYIERVFFNRTKNIDVCLVRDYEICEKIIISEYYGTIDYFWVYLKNKYQLPNIEKYFENNHELLKTVYYECMIQFKQYCEDSSYSVSKNKKINFISHCSWRLNQFLERNLIIVLALFFGILCFSLANSFDSDIFMYDLFLSLGTAFIFAVMLSWINKGHKRRTDKIKVELLSIKKWFENLQVEYAKLESLIMNETIENKKGFLVEFCGFNNWLENHINNKRNVETLKTCSIYKRLPNIESIMFDESSLIVRNCFHRENGFKFESITNDDMVTLIKQTIEFGNWLEAFKEQLYVLEKYYELDIILMNDNEL